MKKIIMRPYIKKCDNCGKINPPILHENPRLCAACAEPNGFYRRVGDSLGANGKIQKCYLGFPFRILWRGWFPF